MSIALDKQGAIYAWGEGYSVLPMKIIFSEKVVDISGSLLLTENGEVYNISNLSTPVQGLKNIAKISAGSQHNLALDVHGVVYGYGTNSYGELGSSSGGVSQLAYDMYEISAGSCTTFLQKDSKNIYVLRI